MLTILSASWMYRNNITIDVTATMRSSSVALLFLLAVAAASRLSLVAASASRSSIADTLGRELRALVAKADNMFRSAGWNTTTADEDAFAESKNVRAVAAARRRARKPGGAGAKCVTAATCRKRRVLCGKRCYGAAAAAASTSVNHVPRCVVKCKKCVPTC